MERWRIVILLLLAWQCCFAQDVNTYFHHLNVENGLSESTNLYTFKDSHGFVWISSISGLNRFDGRQVRIYQPESADSNALFGQNIQSPFFEDRNSDIWFSTYEGINRYNRKQDNFTHFILKDSASQTPLTGYYIAYLDNSDKLWLLIGEQFIYLFDTKTNVFTKKHRVKANSQRLHIQADTKRKVLRSFANTWNAGNSGVQMTEYLDENTIKQETLFDKSSKTPLTIFDFFFQKSTVWLSHNSGVSLYDFDRKKLTTYPLAATHAIHIAPLNANAFLVSTNRKGLLILNKSDGSVTRQIRHEANNPHTIASDIVSNAELNTDNVFFQYVPQYGIDYANFSKNKFQNIFTQSTTATLTKPFVAVALATDGTGNLLSGSTTQGIRLFSKNGVLKDSFVAQTPSARGLAINVFTQFFSDKKERIWYLYYNYLGFYDEKKRIFQSVDTKNVLLLYGFLSHSGKLIFATFSGVYELVENPNNRFEFKPIDKIPNAKPHTILFEDNDQCLWSSYDVTSIRIYNPQKQYELVKELPINGVITGFWHQPNSSIIWMCSQNGLFKIDKKTWAVQTFTEAAGLPSRTINAMQADAKMNLWLGTSKGLAKFDPSVNKAHAYNLVDGISDLNFNMYASAKAADGTLYFGTNNGITWFHPDKITPLSILAHPTITSMLINDQEAKQQTCTETGATNISEIKHLELPYDKNTLSFTFSAMEYSDPMNCTFQYKMEGVDNDWVQSGTQNFTRYANLKAGTYRFWLKAANSDGIWNETPSVLQITIVPPFYRTWWFLSLMALTFIALAWYSYRLYWQRKYRIIQLQLEKEIALNTERQRIAADMHDDIGSDLSALNLKAEMIRHKAKAGLNLDADITNLVDFTRDIAKKVREVIWTVNARHDSLSSIINYFDHYADEFFDPTDIVVRTSLPPTIPKVDINGEARKILLMCYKEALNNLHKHAQATEVRIDFSVENNQFSVSVADDGKGFDPSVLTRPSADSNGLAHIPVRMQGIGGDCAIQTSPKGTTLVFSVPI